MKKGLVTFVLASTLIGLTGCSASNNTKNNLRNNVNNNMAVNDVRYNVQNVNDHNLRYSNKAGRAVENLQEVDLAHVIIRNNTAYVAVRLKNDRFQTGTGTTNNRGNMNTTSTNNNLGTTGTNGRDTHYNSYGAGTGLNGNYPGTTGVTGIDNTGTGLNADAGKGANTRGAIGIRGTGSNTGTVNNITNPFTGTNDGTAGTNDGTTRANYRSVSSPLDQRIERQVRSADSAVKRVYISYDRNFFRQMTDYSNSLNNKNRFRNNNLWNDFTNTVNNVFR